MQDRKKMLHTDNIHKELRPKGAQKWHKTRRLTCKCWQPYYMIGTCIQTYIHTYLHTYKHIYIHILAERWQIISKMFKMFFIIISWMPVTLLRLYFKRHSQQFTTIQDAAETLQALVCMFRFDGEQSESGGDVSSIDSPWSRSIEDLHGDCSLPSPSSSVPRTARHSIR